MSSRVVLRHTVPGDAAALAPRLREADRVELTLSSGPDLLRTLEESIAGSSENITATIDDEVVGIGGCGFTDGVGVPWMVSSDALTQRPLSLTRIGLFSIERYAPQCKALINYVHAHNHVHIAWLQRIGFTLGETIAEYGVGKAPFIQFYRYSHV